MTGLTEGTDYTILVAAVNQSDTSDHTDEDGHSRAWEITATVLGPALNLSLKGVAEHVYVDWSPQLISPASYRVQWRSGDQSYDEARQREVPAGSDDFTEAIDGLDNDTTYTVRVEALDGDGSKLVTEEQSVLVVTAHKYFEDRFIVPLLDDNPWMQEAWFDAPVGFHFIGPETRRPCGTYENVQVISLCKPPLKVPRWLLVHELAHHYTLSPYIHADNPDAKLSIMSLWLQQMNPANHISWLRYNIRESVPEVLLRGTGLDAYQGRWPVNQETATLARSVSQQEIPQWFYDTYTSDGTLDTTDLDRLWADLRTMRHTSGLDTFTVGQARAVFGGVCSEAEGRWAIGTAMAYNAWVDGGCVNRRPQALLATPAGAGELEVTWQAPLFWLEVTPSIDAYTVQWKSGDQEYDTTRQAIVTDLDSRSHTITGLTAGTSYTVRVAAVNQIDTADFTDDDGRRAHRRNLGCGTGRARRAAGPVA